LLVLLENSNINSQPFECNFSDLKDELEKLPMAIFDNGYVVIIWKSKRIIAVFHLSVAKIPSKAYQTPIDLNNSIIEHLRKAS